MKGGYDGYMKTIKVWTLIWIGSTSALRPQPRRMLEPVAPSQQDPGTKGSSSSASKADRAILCQVQGGPAPMPPSLLSDLQMVRASCRRAGRPLGEALVLWNAAVALDNAQQWTKAKKMYDEFLGPCRRTHYTPGVLVGMSSAATDAFLLGDLATSVELWEACLALASEAVGVVAQTSGSRWVSEPLIAASCLNNIGLALLYAGDTAGVFEAFAQALERCLEVDDPGLERVILANQSLANGQVGDFGAAKECVDRHLELTVPAGISVADAAEGAFERVANKTTPLVSRMEQTYLETNADRQLRESLDQAGETSAVLSQLGAMAQSRGSHEEALRFFTQVRNIALSTGNGESVASSAFRMGLNIGAAKEGDMMQ
ncbi:hypothetical protein KIPB_005444, partial [Kipferlia bialata]|eukprot:g5444.t1